jgi:Prokaryotic membrane lipoprotein lipid attachment site
VKILFGAVAIVVLSGCQTFTYHEDEVVPNIPGGNQLDIIMRLDDVNGVNPVIRCMDMGGQIIYPEFEMLICEDVDY